MSTSVKFGQRAEAVLRDMQTYYHPTLESYKAVMYAIANTGDISTATLQTSGQATLESAVVTNDASIGGSLDV